MEFGLGLINMLEPRHLEEPQWSGKEFTASYVTQ